MALLVVLKQTRELETFINLIQFKTLNINFFGWLVKFISSKSKSFSVIIYFERKNYLLIPC